MHHPLTRQQTRDSLRSWWSDRNPVGPNINLHAATKPLMRFMYRRDVLALIDKNRGIPLTNEDMEIYSSYLAYKYVSASTKRAILMELQMRVKSESDACAVADSFLVYLLDEFLSSPDIEMRKSMCRLLAVLTQHQAAVLPLLRGNPCPQLVSLLKGSDIGVVADATEALCSIAKCPEGAQAVVDSNVFDCLAALLVSANEEIRKWPCDLLAELARHETIAMAVAGSLVSLLRAGEFVVLRHAAKILERIATSSDGAQAVVDGEIGSRVSELLESPDVWARQWTCSMLDEVAGSENAALAALCIISCPHLVSLLRDQYSDVISMAAKVLYHITASPDGAQAALDANVLECLPPLLESPDPEVCGWTRNLLQRLAHHETKMRAAVVGHAVALLWSAKIPVIQAGLRILHDITISPQGATLAVDANVLGRVAHLVESADTEVQTWTWDMMLNLVQNETTARSAVGTLVSLLWRGDSRASQRVADILYQTVNSTKGAQVAMEATVLGLVESAHPAVKRWA
ncbi:armadillo-type protein [Mycena latifolia]|nr:armadillo-type protein [Mycena latifolia]